MPHGGRTTVHPTESRPAPDDYRTMAGTSFRFRLERVRALRERSEDAAKQALGEAMQQRHVCSEELDRAEEQVARARQAQLDTTNGLSSVSDLLGRQAFLERSERAALATRQDLQRHDHAVEQRRQLLSAAARDRQALERLKENRRADHEREAARREGQVLDEIALNSFRRRAA